MIRDVVKNVRDFVEAPLTEPLNLEHLFLIVGGVIIFAGMWHLILAHLNQVVSIE